MQQAINTPNRLVKLLISIVLPLSIGGIAGVFTSKSIPTWYTTLNQPSFNPPNWVFAPVWTFLYLLMGISFYLIWILPASKKRNTALLVFLIQLALNFLWSFLFFYFHTIGLALAEIIVLWVSILILLFQFYALYKPAAYLNIPYLLWVSFATVLNASYFMLN